MELISYAVRAAVVHGAEALPVLVEVSLSQSLPGMTIVGMGDVAVREASSRVRCAFRELGFEWPRGHVTVNLAPGELRKTGTGFDVPIAVAILACTGQIPTQDLDACLFVGELGLTGEVGAVRGLVAYDMLACEQGLTMVGPAGSVRTGAGETRVMSSLTQLRHGVGELPLARTLDSWRAGAAEGRAGGLDFADVVDQELAKRAFVIAAAGRHGILMVGPPGSGKSMMAKRMPTILPPLADDERSEVLLVHSIAGEDLERILAGERPFRAPHHAISMGGLVGGGRPVMPGEVSLAHGGVLFLDELPQFGPGALQALRQPMEDHMVRLSRVEGNYDFPCDFMLVAAANPCPCGYLGDPDHACTCSATRIQSYQSRIGGPLMDRIDVLVDVARPASGRVIAGERGTSSESMAAEVAGAREFAAWRRHKREDDRTDRSLGVPELGLTDEAASSLEQTARRLGLGGRNIVRIARVARTVADLARHERVGRDDVVEACAFRTRATL